MAVVFELVRAVNRFANHKKARKRGGPVVAGALAAFQLVADALGLLSTDVHSFQEEVKTKRCAAMGIELADIESKVAARANARATKDWAESDRLRDELEHAGVVLMDGTDGTSWRIRVGDPA